MKEPFATKAWAENHQVMSDGIARGINRLAYAARKVFRRVAPDETRRAIPNP